MQRMDDNRGEIRSDAIIAFSCVRNEALRLPYFLDYHQALGVDRFVFVDNGSTDGTRDLLLAREDTLVFHTADSYAGSRCGMDWVNALLGRFGVGHWIVTLEPDELLVYPRCEQVNLKALTCDLDANGVQAMKTFLVDMYSDKPISQTRYRVGEPFLDTCCYFDTDSYLRLPGADIPERGGPRHRLFWEGRDRPGKSPFLINVPLVRWRKDLAYTGGTHLISSVTPGPLTGAKLHFKFFSDFYGYAESESARNEHWDNAAQYKAYWDVLRGDGDLCAMYPGSAWYRDSMQLVELGLMHLPAGFVGAGAWGATARAPA
jgi:hypothetical protein